MIIVSQDKNNIINFNNIVSIGMEDFDTNSSWQRISAETIRTRATLGDYKTEKRAKEVLQEIIEAIKGKNNIVMTQEEIRTEMSDNLYEMPEE